ncbi:MAG: S-layer homology domain-containing protein [Bacillota bacterium]
MRKILAMLLAIALLCFCTSGYAAATTTTPNPATAVVIGPTTEIPHDSWDYNAVLKLYNDGIDGGFSDATFSGGQKFTRFDMAKFIHSAQGYVKANPTKVNATDITLLNKLSVAYAGELKTLGVEAAQIQNVSQTSALLELVNSAYWMPKFSFQAEIDMDSHFSNNPASNSTNAKSINTAGYQYTFYPDVYLQMQINGRVSSDWYYYTELRFDPGGVNDSTNGALNATTPLTYLRQIEAFGNLYGTTTYAGGTPAGGQPNQNYFGQAFGVTGYIGRMADQLPFNDNTGNQGIVIDNHMNGVRLAMSGNKWSGDLFGGYEDASFSNYSNFSNQVDPANAFITGADVGYSLSDSTQFYGGYYQFWQYSNNSATGNAMFPGTGPIQFVELGLEQALNSKTQLTVYASGSPNYNINTLSPYANAGTPQMYTAGWQDQVGILARLAYGGFDQTQQGSWQVYGQASRIGAGAIWGSSDTNAANYDNEVYQPNRVLGAQGYEIGADWAPIHNTDFHLSFSQTFPMHTPASGSQILQNGVDDLGKPTSQLYNDNTTSPYNVLKCELNYFF